MLEYITINNSRKKVYHVVYDKKGSGRTSICETTGEEAPYWKTTEHVVEFHTSPPSGYNMCGQCLNIAYSNGLLDVRMTPKRSLIYSEEEDKFIERPMTVEEYNNERKEKKIRSSISEKE